MKKTELTQLTQIIEHLVAREVRKQLPKIIAEVFQNGLGKPVITEAAKPQPKTIVTEAVKEAIEHDDMKASLREIFAGVTRVDGSPTAATDVEPTQPKQQKQYTKNPILNQILNETTGDLRSRDRMVGSAAFHGGYSSLSNMGAGVGRGAMPPPGEIAAAMKEGDPDFMKNAPTMAPRMSPSIPISKPPVLAEGQESTHAPLAALPEGMSVVDVAGEAGLDFSRMRAVLARSKEKRH